MFILNILVEQTKFQYNEGSISNRNLTNTLSVDIYGSGQCKVIHLSSLTYTSSDIHGIRKSICTPIHVFKKIYLAFSIEIEHCNVVSEGILKLQLSMISTLSNNDVIHGVPGYFKCRKLPRLVLT